MYWLIIGLFAVGVACGTALRLPMFLLILLGAALLAVLSGIGQGGAWPLANAVIAVVAMQLGYGVGFVLRTAIRYWYRQKPVPGSSVADPAEMEIGTKRR